MLRRAPWLVAIVLVSLPHSAPAQSPDRFRPPSVPLVTHHPYFSVWSPGDRPTDDWSRHWTGKTQAFCSLARIDGKPYRLLGKAPASVEPMEMTGRTITPTRTTYTLEGGGVAIEMSFLSPLLPHDLIRVSRPVTYVKWAVKAMDGKRHDVSIYFDSSAEIAVDTPDQLVAWERGKTRDGIELLRIGTAEQKVLSRVGDDLRIDWGYFYVGIPGKKARTAIVDDRTARYGFAKDGSLPAADDPRLPRAANDDWPVLSVVMDFDPIGPEGPIVARHLLLAYDEIWAVEYLGERLHPYRRFDGQLDDGPIMIEEAERDYLGRLPAECERFDRELMTDAERVGGKAYAQLCALAYRQCLAAHVLVAGPKGEPLYFSKENFSNGCIATVDVTYPSSPFFLLLNPTLLKGQLIPILDYAASGRWKFPFAPHDLGTYPKANGQVYGGGEKTEKDQMPVEECGNMLVMVAALAEAEGNADFAEKYWPQLSQWANYLKEKGLDPENQLCTDDFAGHLAHNTNLSLKAIVALGGFTRLCEKTGRHDEAAAYRKLAEEMAARWVKMADDGDHYRLAFDKPGTWSQKYNLVWDKLLDLKLFPPEVARKEVAFYLAHQNEFGLPLDNRSQYTKLDWIVWTATLADSRKDFETFIGPVVKFLNRTPDRVPMTDWYWTHDAKQRGFQARSVVGGVFIKMLEDRDVWARWRSRAGR